MANRNEDFDAGKVDLSTPDSRNKQGNGQKTVPEAVQRAELKKAEPSEKIEEQVSNKKKSSVWRTIGKGFLIYFLIAYPIACTYGMYAAATENLGDPVDFMMAGFFCCLIWVGCAYGFYRWILKRRK